MFDRKKAEKTRKEDLKHLEETIQMFDLMIRENLKTDPHYLDNIDWKGTDNPRSLMEQEAFQIAAIKYRSPYYRYLFTGDYEAYMQQLHEQTNQDIQERPCATSGRTNRNRQIKR